ncbi:MAG: 2-amino-4-hydroxy-6-hydroxymethyldihydropteridine diphosphokinase [Ruminococcus sp.]|nr:2-amino-4-hydroxy-6-hydroxymethyldihydropteridine diphosphokinase [Ruminococcus sp.]
MDKIKIKDLEVFANHGVFPEENVLGQKFLVSLTMYTDTRRAGQTDNLTASIHYGEVSQFIHKYMKEHTFQLIERVAESLAEELLLNTAGLEKVLLEVKKPWAPIGLPLDFASVEIERGWHTAYIALGSNMGEKENYLDVAVEKLKSLSKCEVTKVSEWLVTKPYGGVEQDDFLNGCLELRTLLTPEELLDKLHEIEAEAGRERIIHWGPRTLDLDILLYDDLAVQKDDLCIPHVDMHNREFVLKPLCEIAPYKRHPVYGKTVYEMLNEL